MKKFLIQFVLLIIVIFGALYIYKAQSVNLPFIPQGPKLEQVIIGNVKINVEIAGTQEKRNKGLGGRESLASDSGMLFVFERVDKYPFWMKGLKFPLDFIWIRDNKIIDITENVSAPVSGQKDADLPIYTSKEPIDKVLEVNGGFVKLHNIKIGDEIKLIQ